MSSYGEVEVPWLLESLEFDQQTACGMTIQVEVLKVRIDIRIDLYMDINAYVLKYRIKVGVIDYKS